MLHVMSLCDEVILFSSVLYVQSSLTSEAEVFLDPNTLSEDGTTALTDSEFTEDGELIALALSEKGSDWNTIKVIDMCVYTYCIICVWCV